MFSLCISGLSSVQDHVHLMSPCGGSVPGDSYTRQKDQLLCLQTAGRGGQGARSQHGLPAWGLWLHRVQPRGDPLAEWEFDRRHNVAIHTASQVEENVFYFVSSQQKLPFKDAHKIFLPQIFPGSWRSGCHWVVFMNEDPTGSLTDASTTVTSSSMTKVPSSVASCSIQWQLVAFLCTHSLCYFIYRWHSVRLQEVPFIWCRATRKRCFPERKCIYHSRTDPRVSSQNSHWKGMNWF